MDELLEKIKNHKKIKVSHRSILNVGLGSELYGKIRAFAKTNGISGAKLIRLIIEDFLEKVKEA